MVLAATKVPDEGDFGRSKVVVWSEVSGSLVGGKW